MDVAEQLLARLLREIEHDVAQKDDVKALRPRQKGRLVRAEIGLAEVGEHLELGFDHPVFPMVIEETDNITAGRPRFISMR